MTCLGFRERNAMDCFQKSTFSPVRVPLRHRSSWFKNFAIGFSGTFPFPFPLSGIPSALPAKGWTWKPQSVQQKKWFVNGSGVSHSGLRHCPKRSSTSDLDYGSKGAFQTWTSFRLFCSRCEINKLNEEQTLRSDFSKPYGSKSTLLCEFFSRAASQISGKSMLEAGSSLFRRNSSHCLPKCSMYVVFTYTYL